MKNTEFKKCSDVLNRGIWEGLHKEEIVNVLQIMLNDIMDDENETFSEEDRDFIGRNITEVCEAYSKEYKQEDLKFAVVDFSAKCNELYDFLHEKFKPIIFNCDPNVRLKALASEDVTAMKNVLGMILERGKISFRKKISSFAPTLVFLLTHVPNFFENYKDFKEDGTKDFHYYNYGCDMKNVSFKDKIGFMLYAFKNISKYREDVLQQKYREKFIRKQGDITPQVLAKLSGIQE